jgi:hypothetical protein
MRSEKLMEPEKINIILVGAPDDPAERDPKYQAELTEFSRSLRAAGASVSQSAIVFDSVEGGGYPTGHFAVALASIAMSAITTIVVAWIRQRGKRKVRVKIGSTYAEASTAEDVVRVLEAAAEYERKSRTKGDVSS